MSFFFFFLNIWRNLTLKSSCQCSIHCVKTCYTDNFLTPGGSTVLIIWTQQLLIWVISTYKILSPAVWFKGENGLSRYNLFLIMCVTLSAKSFRMTLWRCFKSWAKTPVCHFMAGSDTATWLAYSSHSTWAGAGNQSGEHKPVCCKPHLATGFDWPHWTSTGEFNTVLGIGHTCHLC